MQLSNTELTQKIVELFEQKSIASGKNCDYIEHILK